MLGLTGGIPTARYQDIMAILLPHFKRLLHNSLWEDLTANQFFCLYFRLRAITKEKDYNRKTVESVVLLKDVTLESLPRSFSPFQLWKANETEYSSASLQSQHSGWTEVLDWHNAFTEVGQEHATRTRGLVPCLHHHIPDKSELLPNKKDVSDTSTIKQNGWDSTNMVY